MQYQLVERTLELTLSNRAIGMHVSTQFLPKLVLPCLALLATNAQAVVSEDLTIGSAKALGLGNAVTADPPGIDSVHFNPAGLARMKGRQFELKIFGGAASVEMGFDDYYTDSWTEKMFKTREGSPDDFVDDEVLGQTSEIEGWRRCCPGPD